MADGAAKFSVSYLSLPERYRTSKFLNLRMKYRSNVEIMALMIENMKGSGAGQYSIMRHVGTNHVQLKKYLGCLIEMGFIETHEKEGQALYRASEKGLDFLRQYYVLLGMLLNAYTRNKPPEAICQEAKCDSPKGQQSFTARFAAP